MQRSLNREASLWGNPLTSSPLQVKLIPLLITTVCYLLTAWGFYRDGNLGLGLAFFGYAFANLGFLYIVIWGAP